MFIITKAYLGILVGIFLFILKKKQHCYLWVPTTTVDFNAGFFCFPDNEGNYGADFNAGFLCFPDDGYLMICDEELMVKQ